MNNNKVLTLLTILIIFVVLFFFQSCSTKSKDEELLDIMVVDQINSIVRTYANSSSSELLSKANANFIINSTNINRTELTKMNENDRILFLDFKGNKTKNHLPIEIYAIFESFLFLKEHSLPYTIVAVACNYQSGEAFDADSTLITITTNEFENLYDSIDIKTGNRSKIAKKLADKWVEIMFYNRSNLKFGAQEEYKALLITPWSRHQKSFSNSFNARYQYDKNQITIDKISKHNEIYSTTLLETIQVNEEGFLYGAWDNQNNIWLYGEKIGVVLLEYDGASSWTKKQYLNELMIPYPLEKVMETHH